MHGKMDALIELPKDWCNDISSFSDWQPLAWSPQFECGIEAIDAQHRVFLDLVNKVISNRSSQLVRRYLDEVALYARFHFVSEENMMVAIGYDGYEEHRNLHQQLVQELGNLFLAFDAELKSVDDIISSLVTWFVDHTTQVDKEFGRFCSRKEK